MLSGLGLAYGANAWERAEARRAYLEALPAGYVFPGCDAVRAAGIAPIYHGERGFTEGMDGDGDGIGCEPYRG